MWTELYKYKESFLKLLKRADIDIFDVIIFLIPIVTFGYALYVYFPGVLTFDSYNQLTQVKTFEFLEGHPLVHTLIELLLLKIWNSPGIIGIFQILTFSAIWTRICKYNRGGERDLGLGIIQVLITLFICANPLNAMHSITLWKDILYSYMLLLLSFVFQICADKGFILKNVEILGISFLLALIPNLRFNGLTVFLGCLAILAIILGINGRTHMDWIKFFFLTLSFFVLFQVPSKILINKTNSPSSEVSGVFYYKTLHLTADYLQKDIFTEEDRDFLDAFLSLEDLSLHYNPYFLDPISSVEVDRSLYQVNKSVLWGKLLRRSLENPRAFLSYIRNSTVIVWKMKLPSNMVGTVLTTGYNASNNIDNIQQIHVDEPYFKRYNEHINDIFSSKVWKTIFFNPAFHLYSSIILIFLGVVAKIAKRSYLLILLPNFLNTFGLIFTIPVQDVRYVYASFLTGYLVFLVVLSNLIKARHKFKNVKTL